MERLSREVSDMGRRAGEFWRKVNRFTEGPMTRKKLLIIFLIAIFLFLYVGPTLMNWFYGTEHYEASDQNLCHKQFLNPFADEIKDYDAYVRYETLAKLSPISHNYVPYVGNGFVGMSIEYDSHLNIKYGRTLSLPVQFYPLYVVEDFEMKEFTVAEYTKGIIHRFQCSNAGLQISYKYYAHRTIPSLFVQEILINNPSKSSKTVKFTNPRISENWREATTRTQQLKHGTEARDYEIVSGSVSIPETDKILAVSIVFRKISSSVHVEAKDVADLFILTSVQYSHPIKESEYVKIKEIVEKKAIEAMQKAITLTSNKLAITRLKENHIKVWQSLWYTGFYISDSKAQGVINGDRINATIYAILSQVRSFEHEEDIKPATKSEILKTLTYSEGCYEGHSTLDAFNLWKPLDSLENLNAVASVWLLTLEKQGCHNLLKAGASGVNQAILLSFGSLRFSNQHLEYNIHPSKLHRDFVFRRVNYGNMTHLNISVVVQEDNKAALFVALDRSDKTYYACDGGCLDDPVQLGPYRKYFPVKLTDPLTAILYITADKQHMEDLRLAIHVREVAEAPAHENHVIALHKHGHSLGGLNPLFWISIIVLIVVFHLFLFRIIMNEFCDNSASYRRLYNKP